VQTDDERLRRRIRRALRRPIYTWDAVTDANGQRLYCRRIWVYPGDERHAHEVLMNVGACGLHDVVVEAAAGGGGGTCNTLSGGTCHAERLCHGVPLWSVTALWHAAGRAVYT
jgi:hypothetical protein